MFGTADIKWDTAHLSLKEQVDLRRFLRAQQYFLANEERVIDTLVEVMMAAFYHVVDALPALPDIRYPIMTVPVVDLLSIKPGHVIERITSTFLGEDLADLGLFTELRETIYVNACRASSIVPYEDSRKAFIPASRADMPAEELLSTYLAGTPFPDLFAAHVPFVIPRKTYCEHGALFAKSGHGKTQTLRAFVSGFLEDDDPPAMFIIDSLGALIEDIADLDVFQTRLKDRLVILDPSDPYNMPSLDFFNLQSDELCFYFFKAIDQSFTTRQATMISYLMELMRNIRNATLLTLIQVCESGANPYPDAAKNISPFAQRFFEKQFYAKKPDPLVQQTKNQIAARLYTLGRLPKFQRIFAGTQAGVVFDPFASMQQKKICLINTDARPPKVGGLGEASSILGRFVLAQCLEAAHSRPKGERHLALIVVDEAKHYMDDQSALILSDARQFGMGMLLATQFPHQLDEGVRKEINTNTSIKLMGPVEYAVASQYSRDMFTTPEFIMSMKSYDRSHAEWACYVANMTERALKLRVPFGVLEAMPKRKKAPEVRQSTDPVPGESSLAREKGAETTEQPQKVTTSATTQPRPAAQPNQPDEQTDAAEPLIKPGKTW